MKIFVTGGTGFIGRNFITTVLRKTEDVEVICLVRPTSGNREALQSLVSPRLQLCEGDLMQVSSFRQQLQSCDTVVHLAAQTGKASKKQFEETNIVATANLLAESKLADVQRFCYCSTIAARYEVSPLNHYANSKRESEEQVSDANLNTVIIRPTIVVGKDSPVIQGLKKLAFRNRLVVFGRAENLVQPVWIDDLTSVLSEVVVKRGDLPKEFDVGGRDQWPLSKFLSQLIFRVDNASRISVPLKGTRLALGLVEPLLLPLLPLTAGQLSLFANAAVANPGEFMDARPEQMMGITEMLLKLHGEPHGKDDTSRR